MIDPVHIRVRGRRTARLVLLILIIAGKIGGAPGHMLAARTLSWITNGNRDATAHD